MNLTFYPRNNEKENSNIFSNYLKKKTRLFPSIFSNFETDPNKQEELSKDKNLIKLPRYRNIKKEILDMKKEINYLYDIKNSIFREMRPRFNSICYKNFVKGFGKYFFGPFGIITKRYKYLKEYYIHKSLLNNKIYAGKLDYYEYTSKKTNVVTARENETKKRRLSLSNNYAVVFDKNDVYSMKAITSKRLVNYKKNFVDINRSRYLNNNLKPIIEIPDIISKKNNKNRLKQRKKMQIRLNTYNNCNKNKNDNKIKRKNFSFITETNKNSEHKDLYKNIFPKIQGDFLINKQNNIKRISRKSNLFLTQSNFKLKNISSKLFFNDII